jgi:hypothetical protein
MQANIPVARQPARTADRHQTLLMICMMILVLVVAPRSTSRRRC